MKILIFFSILIVTILFIGRKIYSSAKSNLFKDQAAWSGKDIKIKYTRSIKASESKENENILKVIADESKIYLEDQSRLEEKDNK